MLTLRRCSLVVAALLPPVWAHAQTVRGVAVDQAGRPVPGAVVQLFDSSSVWISRSLSNERGEFRLAGTHAGRYTIKTLRIGYRPESFGQITLRIGEELSQRVVLAGIPISLEAVRIVDRNACRSARDSAAATFAVWEQARTALTATQLTGAAKTVAATTVIYERSMDPGSRRVKQQSSNLSADFVTQPWRSAPGDSLHRAGYVVIEYSGETTYFGPGLDVLLSELFVDDHCLRLVTDRDRTRIGVSFEPTPTRRAVPEIRGTLWLDRASSELRRLEFRYVNLPPEQEEFAAGEMDFVRMKNAAWAVSTWSIRMPVLERVVRSSQFGGAQVKVAEVRVAGGELALVRRGADTLWSHPPLVLAGAVRDSVTGSMIAGARVALGGTTLQGATDAQGRFTIPGVLPGEYTLEVRTASLDSVSTIHQSSLMVTDAAAPIEIRVPDGRQVMAAVCGTRTVRDRGNGIVIGRVRAQFDSAAPRNVSVVAEWNDVAVHTEAGVVVPERKPRWLETHTDARGGFRLCWVPVSTNLTLRATSDTLEAAPVYLRIAEDGRFARAEFVLDRVSSRMAVFTGIVTDSMTQPILGAEVELTDLARSTLTNEHGVFRLIDIPPGVHRVVVRHIGNAPADTSITFAAAQTVDWRFMLKRSVQLDSVVVTAAHRDVPMEEFEENRKLGLGHFVTRDQIAKFEGLQASEVLEGIPGLKVVYAGARHAFILNPGIYASNPYYRQRGDLPGIRTACYAQAYLDGTLMNPPVAFDNPPAPGGGTRRATPPFDVNSIPPNQIEAIEYYASPAEAPARYSGLGTECGVILIHTRRVK